MTPAPSSAQQARWEGAWEGALAAWSRFTQLTPPRWCLTVADEKAQGLSGSFAMIRFADHAVVISLRQVAEQGLDGFATEILAHEIGHHVYAPGDLRDHARLLARMRAALPGVEAMAGLCSNLYTDLLINDRLQRSAGLDMAGVYRALLAAKQRTAQATQKAAPPDALWQLYMGIYEQLWSLPFGALSGASPGALEGAREARLRSDAYLGARVIRAYAKDWLAGAGRFAALLLDYLLEAKEKKQGDWGWLDASGAGAGEVIPDGLAEVDEDEVEGVMHPAEDPALTGMKPRMSDAEHPGSGTAPATDTGVKNRYREPNEYVRLMEALGVKVSPKDLVIRYYRERATPHIIPFPAREVREAADPLPEGLDVWDVGSPLSQVDWVSSLARSPLVIPGLTTLERTYGTTEGATPARVPVDLYLGVDCSGSMRNPATGLSWPVLAGTVMALSALRAGAKVKVCLSGEPGRFTETERPPTRGFLRDTREILSVLTNYLGTGYAFGVLRLKDTFLDGPPLPRPAHLLVLSDTDFFYMLKQVEGGWDIARDAAKRAGGGASAVLDIASEDYAKEDIARLRSLGWDVYCVSSSDALVQFARAFARRRYAREV